MKILPVDSMKLPRKINSSAKARVAKVCTRCGVRKPMTAFAVCSAKKDGRKSTCKKCGAELTREWAKLNPAKKKAADKKWRLANLDKERKRLKKYVAANRERVLQRYREWYRENREQQLAKGCARYAADPEKYNLRSRQNYAANPKRWNALAKKWREANREKVAASKSAYGKANRKKLNAVSLKWYKENRPKRRAYVNKRRAEDPIFKMHANLSARFRLFLGGVSKSESVRDLIGCDYEYLWQHLERNFSPGMARGNYGKIWHVDHFKPCAEFDPRIKAQRAACWHFSNLQPMFTIDNIRKGGKWSEHLETEYKRRRAVAEATNA